MATTTNYGWATPDDTDLVKDGAAAIRTLGTSIDTSFAADEGDLLVGGTSDIFEALPIGAAGTVLTSDGDTAEWAAPASPSPASASAVVATNQNTTSVTYTDLATAGPAVTLTTGTKALVIVTALQFPEPSRIGYMSYAVSGATTIAANDAVANIVRSPAAGDNDDRHSAVSRLSTLTAGSNTFTAKYKASAGAARYIDREICVIDLGS